VPIPTWTDKQAKVLRMYQTKKFKKLILTGAVRSGKTIVNNAIFINELLAVKQRATAAGVKTPLFILAGVSSKTINNNVIVPLTNDVPFFQDGIKWDKNGGFTLLGVKVVLAYTGNVGGAGAIRGLTAWGAYVNEASLARETVFKEIESRLSAPGSRMILDTNPDNPSHWLKTEYIDKASDPEKQILVETFTIDDNEFLDPDYVSTIKAQFSGVFYDRAIRGLWVLSDGAIYANFDKDTMVVDMPADTTYEQDWVSVDYGTLNATVYKRWSLYQDTWYNTDEFYYSGRESRVQRTDEEYVDDMEKFYQDNGLTKRTKIILDPSAASFKAALKKRGFKVKAARNNVLNGIRAQMSAMNEGKIKWTPKAEYTFKEFGLYVWDEAASNRGEDKPVKEHDHCMDADRYFVYTVLNRKQAFMGWEDA
jgi:PBSX family phage terminase large subunit